MQETNMAVGQVARRAFLKIFLRRMCGAPSDPTLRTHRPLARAGRAAPASRHRARPVEGYLGREPGL